MFKNYLKIAFRNIKKYKLYSFINIAGLAVGMSVCILIMLFVKDELSYDRYHENAGRIYRVIADYHISKGSAKSAVTSATLAPTLIEKFPEIAHAVRFDHENKAVIQCNDNLFSEERFFFADAAVFNVFTFPFIKGDPRTALQEPNSVVLTEETAQKYFGHELPIGKTIILQNKGEFKVTGILHNIPHNSHFTFDFLASFVTFGKIDNPWAYQGWTYILLPEDYDATLLEEKFAANKEELGWYSKGLQFYLQSLKSIHLHSHLSGEIEANSDIRSLYIFSVIAFFIMLIACINFMSLATARSAHRACEVGVRKVLGARRVQLTKQFLGESILFSSLALALALALVELFLPAFNQLVRKPLQMDYTDSWLLLLTLIFVSLLVGFVSGSYPAFFLSAFQPTEVLKGGRQGPSGRSSRNFRYSSVVIQFMISIALIISTGIIGKQLKYMHRKELGFHKKHIVEIPIANTPILKSYPAFKAELMKHPNILNVSAAMGSPLDGKFKTSQKINDEEIEVHYLLVDHDYIETLGMTLLRGRNFSKDSITDATEAVILNERAVKTFGLKDAIGKNFKIIGGKGVVVGVVRDFHSESLHEQIQPTALQILPKFYRNILVRIRQENISATIKFLALEWREFAPHRPFEYIFLDEAFNKLYRAEDSLARIFGYFSSLAIFIACLGLFGLASFTAERRIKEICIRKVLGASVREIVLLLSKEFTRWVLIANIIAWPIAYFVMNRWLQNFAYRINIGIGIFLLSAMIAFVIALATVSFQAVKAALSNPVDVLKYE